MATIKDFKELEIWQIAHELHKEIISLSRATSLSRDFSLRDQVERSAGSGMDNIEEGFGRGSKLEFIHFLSIAKASITETQSQLIRIHDQGYINEERFDHLDNIAQKAVNKIAAFMQYLNKSQYKGQKVYEQKRAKQQQTTNTKQRKCHS